jgi:inner membrane protein involved in colicin E2 resistance
MKPIRLIAIALIFILTTAGWWTLGVTLGFRTDTYGHRTSGEVNGLWGPSLQQPHPRAQYNDASGSVTLLPATSKVTADLTYDPRKRGLQWHRTYDVVFTGEYTFGNPTQVTQHLKVELPLPGERIRLENFQFTLTGGSSTGVVATTPAAGLMAATIEVAPGKTVKLQTGYRARGMDDWRYVFPDASRIQGFELAMNTNFAEIDYPFDTGSPTQDLAGAADGHWTLVWQYPDVISAQSIGMSMPKVLNPGPVAMQIAFWAPLSLAVFFLVLVITSLMNGVELHPMNYLLLAAGFFAFPLLFAYMVDVVNVHWSFVISATASVLLVCGYLRLVAQGALFKVALPTQLFYLVLFSYSFFLKGLTGLTLTVGGIVTLGLIMYLTAGVDWSLVMSSWKTPRDSEPASAPPLPT